jgi:hypothetical protein
VNISPPGQRGNDGGFARAILSNKRHRQRALLLVFPSLHPAACVEFCLALESWVPPAGCQTRCKPL